MSTKQEASKPEHKTKKFGKSERSIPHHTQKAKKFYPAEDEAKPKKVCEASLIQSKWPSIDEMALWYRYQWDLRDAHSLASIIPYPQNMISSRDLIC